MSRRAWHDQAPMGGQQMWQLLVAEARSKHVSIVPSREPAQRPFEVVQVSEQAQHFLETHFSQSRASCLLTLSPHLGQGRASPGWRAG